VKHQKTGILANGLAAFEYARLISHWTNDLTLFTNGPAMLTDEQRNHIGKHNIAIIETAVARIEHQDGYLHRLVLADGTNVALKALYAGIPKEQSTPVPVSLGCELTELGLIKVDNMQRSSVPGVYACGDNSTMARSVASAVATGNLAGAALNKEMIEESF
jgi:thioredoxin reductase